jgi:hypothetical protein
MSVMQRRAVCLALVATVVLRVPMMRLGDATDLDNAISPLDVVASQLVLPVEHGANGAKRNKAQAEGDPGDLVRALLYPGELGRSVLDAYACATDKTKKCSREMRASIPEWRSSADVRKLKRLDARLTKVFGSKKTTLVAGSFFTIGAAFQAFTKGNPGTLGVFSVVANVWALFSAGGNVAPDVGLVILLAMTYQSYRIAGAAKRARAKKRKAEIERVRLEAEAEKAKKKN